MTAASQVPATDAPATTKPPFGGAFDGRRVFVTGASGFKGAWLCAWLDSLGAEVTAIGLEPPTDPSLFDVLGLRERIDWSVVDIRDAAATADAVRRARPEVVLHLAAQSLVLPSYEDPLTTFATNVMGTANVLDAVRLTPDIACCVNVTSDKCYENLEQPWGYREGDAMGGHDPYSASKGCAELVASSYARSFLQADGAPLLASVRAGNVIGGGDWAAHRLVPDCMRAFGAGEPVELRNPHATRPWQHVLEPLSGYLDVASRMLAGDRDAAGAWNFGPFPTSNLTVGTVVERVAALWGEGAEVRIADVPPARHEANLLQLDVTKAVTRLGWAPTWDADTTLEATVGWYRAWFDDPAGIVDFTERQVDSYVAAASTRSAWAVSA